MKLNSGALKLNIFHTPPAIHTIEQVNCCINCLVSWCVFQSSFMMDSHVQYILSQCAQRMYILKLLHRNAYCAAFHCCLLTYYCSFNVLNFAFPAWGDFNSTEHNMYFCVWFFVRWLFMFYFCFLLLSAFW